MLCACGFKYTPLWIQGLKRLVLWTQNLTLLEDQGLWTQTPVLHLSYAKAASLRGPIDIKSIMLPARKHRLETVSRGSDQTDMIKSIDSIVDLAKWPSIDHRNKGFFYLQFIFCVSYSSLRILRVQIVYLIDDRIDDRIISQIEGS